MSPYDSNLNAVRLCFNQLEWDCCLRDEHFREAAARLETTNDTLQLLRLALDLLGQSALRPYDQNAGPQPAAGA